MRILIIGAAGTAGRAITTLLADRGHDIITVGRTSGDIRCDIAKEEDLHSMWQRPARSTRSSAPPAT